MTNYILRAIIIPIILFLPVLAEEKNAIYYNKIGWEHLSKGDSFRAVISFKEALKLNPRYSKAMAGLGRAYLDTEAYEEAIKLFNDSLKLDKNNVEAINGIGLSMTGLGRYNDALIFFDRALKISEESIDARYGTAHVYYLMDKKIWSSRKLESILKTNPFHYNSLLLMADIKISDGRTEEAKEYIRKAIDSNDVLPEGYIKLGEANLKDFKKTGNTETLAESIHQFEKALAIHPENLRANRSMGYASLLQENYGAAIKYLETALAAYPNNSTALYSLALSLEKNDAADRSLEYYMKALKFSPSDSLLQSKLEDFLVLKDYAAGHPLRAKFSDEHLDIARDRMRKNLSGEAILHLQRSLLLNPMNREARENLKDYYITQNFHSYYVDELKSLYNIFPEKKYQDILSVAIIKRREKLYHRSGYSESPPPRDVPVLLIMDLWPMDEITPHPDAGEVVSNYITFALTQSGRLKAIGVKDRISISGKLRKNKMALAENLENLAVMVRSGVIEKLDFVLFGSFREVSNLITINCELIDFHTGVIISNFNLYEQGREYIPRLSLHVAKRIYDIIPFHGRILKSDENGMVINLGLADGIKPGDLLEISKLNNPEDSGKNNIREKIVLLVEESDTLVLSAKPLKSSDIQHIEINDRVYPLNKKRSKLIK